MQTNNGDILVIDDDPLVLMNYTDILEDAGFNPITADTLGQAWSILCHRNFELIICDHDLTDGKGIELIKKLEKKTTSTPVIYLSAAIPAVLEMVKQHSIVKKVLTKPVDNATLIASINDYKTASDEVKYPRLVGLDERRMLLDDL